MVRATRLMRRGITAFMMAERYMRSNNYARAAALYNKAARCILWAIYTVRKRRIPSKEVSIEYLSRNSGIPKNVYEEFENSEKELRRENELFEKENFVRNLLLYAWNRHML